MIPVSVNQSSSHLLLDLPARFFQSTSFSFTDYPVTSTLSVIDITRIKCDHSVHRFHTLGPTFENSCIHLLNCLGTTHTLAQINGRSLVQFFHSNLQAWPSRHQFCRPYRQSGPYRSGTLCHSKRPSWSLWFPNSGAQTPIACQQLHAVGTPPT